MKYLTKTNDEELDIRTVEEAIRYFVSPMENETVEADDFYGEGDMRTYIRRRDEYISESKEVESLEEFAEIYNRYSDLLFDGCEVVVKEK